MKRGSPTQNTFRQWHAIVFRGQHTTKFRGEIPMARSLWLFCSLVIVGAREWEYWPKDPQCGGAMKMQATDLTKTPQHNFYARTRQFWFMTRTLNGQTENIVKFPWGLDGIFVWKRRRFVPREKTNVSTGIQKRLGHKNAWKNVSVCLFRGSLGGMQGAWTRRVGHGGGAQGVEKSLFSDNFSAFSSF